jgi:hypothetical protein
MTAMRTRRQIASLALTLIFGIVLGDLVLSLPLDPFRAPPAIALGSGQAAAGAHCAAPPGH